MINFMKKKFLENQNPKKTHRRASYSSGIKTPQEERARTTDFETYER